MGLPLATFLAGSLFTLPVYGDVITWMQAPSSFAPTIISESFEQLTVDSNDQFDPDNETVLDSTTVATINGVPVGGPGLVQPGVQFVSTEQLAWNGDGYLGLSTKTLMSESDDSTIEIVFSQPVIGFGVVVSAFEGFGDEANISVLGTDLSRVLFNSGTLDLPSSGSGAGFYVSVGIEFGGALITQRNNPWSPAIDQVTWVEQAHTTADFPSVRVAAAAIPTTTPEPCELTLMSLGILIIAVRNRRKRQGRTS